MMLIRRLTWSALSAMANLTGSILIQHGPEHWVFPNWDDYEQYY